MKLAPGWSAPHQNSSGNTGPGYTKTCPAAATLSGTGAQRAQRVLAGHRATVQGRQPPDELPTIGIVLCHRKNDALVELTLPQDANIFASKYQLYLPSKEELKARLEQITHDLEGQTT